MDRSVGALRKGLRDLKIADNTLVWFCSDNGGLPKITPETVGGLRDFKGSLYEGGLRVPAIIEWPNGIKKPRVTKYPSCTMDIFPTIAQVVGLPESTMLQPQDGISLKKLLNQELGDRTKPIPFNCFGNTALVDNHYKLLHVGPRRSQALKRYELYNLADDPQETTNLMGKKPDIAKRMQTAMNAWKQSMQASFAGQDYPEGKVNPGEPEPRFWTTVKDYEPYFKNWQERPEYRSRLKSKRNAK